MRVFERAEAVGGRCATQLWQGHLVDYGVQYFTAQTSEFKRELLTRLRQFRPIISPILNRDDIPMTSPGGPRFYVLQGNNYLAQVLARGLDTRLNTPVETVSFASSRISCMGETFAAVVSSLPGPQTARLFGLAQSPADYEPGLTTLLEYSGPNVGQSYECYARLSPADATDLSITASFCENHKSGRIVGNKTVFIVQATPRFSRAHVNEPSENYLPKIIHSHEQLWRIPAGQCTASYSYPWLYAVPVEQTRRRVDLPAGAFLCGDSRTDSAVENVWLDGKKSRAGSPDVSRFVDVASVSHRLEDANRTIQHAPTMTDQAQACAQIRITTIEPSAS